MVVERGDSCTCCLLLSNVRGVVHDSGVLYMGFGGIVLDARALILTILSYLVWESLH